MVLDFLERRRDVPVLGLGRNDRLGRPTWDRAEEVLRPVDPLRVFHVRAPYGNQSLRSTNFRSGHQFCRILTSGTSNSTDVRWSHRARRSPSESGTGRHHRQRPASLGKRERHEDGQDRPSLSEGRHEPRFARAAGIALAAPPVDGFALARVERVVQKGVDRACRRGTTQYHRQEQTGQARGHHRRRHRTRE